MFLHNVLCISGTDMRTWPLRMSMEKGQNTEWALNAKANVSHWIAIEVPAKGYKISSSMHSKHFIYRTLSTLSTWQYQELDFRKVSIHALSSRGRIKISSFVEYWGRGIT